MPAPADTDLIALAEAKARRLRLFMIVLTACAVCITISAKSAWYHVEYVADSVGGVQIEQRPSFAIDAGQMAEISRQQHSPQSLTIANPQVAQVLGYPTFIVAPLIGAVVAIIGFWLRSAAFSALGLIGHLYGWILVVRARWWFESAPGRDGWEISRGPGQGFFWLAISIGAVSIIGGALQSLATYRAMRRARVAGGEVVEETAFDMFIRLITRSPAFTRSGSAK